MTRTTRGDVLGRTLDAAADWVVRRALGFDLPVPAARHPSSPGHGTWEVCGIGRAAADGPVELSRR